MKNIYIAGPMTGIEDCTILDAGAGSITYCNFKEAQNDRRTNP
jgi:hypothetical protein